MNADNRNAMGKAGCTAGFAVVKQGKPQAAIAIGANASAAERHAAEELAKYIGEISGASLPIAVEGTQSPGLPNMILIGTGISNAHIRRLIDVDELDLSGRRPGCDGFVVKTVGNCLVLGGSRDRGTIYAVYHLLETYLNVGFFWDGDSVHKTDTIVLPQIDLAEKPAFEYRYSKSASECSSTYNFTIWWEFDEWKNEIDWLMKNKANLVEVKAGEAYVKKLTYQKMGVPVEPVNEDDIRRMKIVKRIYDYCKTVDIDVVNLLHPTEVPRNFVNVYPHAEYFKAKWEAVTSEDSPEGPMPNLYPWDPIYRELVKTYIQTWKETYGPIRMHVGGMPAEAAISADKDVIRRIYAGAPKDLYGALKTADPEGKIAFDGWIMRYDAAKAWDMEGAFREFVDNMDPENACFIDLWPEWRIGIPLYKEKKYQLIKNRKFILAFLNEFGGNDYLHGCYDTAIREVQALTTDPDAENCAGIGNATEVMYYNVNYYDLMFHLGWNPAAIGKEEFINDQVRRRYGPELYDLTVDAFRLFIDAVHTGQITSEAYYQRRVLLHPYGYRSMPRSYSRKAYKKLELYFAKALPVPQAGRRNLFLLNDIYDALRQYITELTNIHIYCIHDAYTVKSPELFELHARALLFLMEQLEHLTGSNEKWHIEKTVQSLKGHQCDEPKYYHMKSAEAIGRFIRDNGTTFAVYCPDSLLDYPGKDYYELIKYYYRPRVEIFVKYIREVLDTMDEPSTSGVEEQLKKLYRPIEVKWVEEGYPQSDPADSPDPLWKAVELVYQNISSNPDVRVQLEQD